MIELPANLRRQATLLIKDEPSLKRLLAELQPSIERLAGIYGNEGINESEARDRALVKVEEVITTIDPERVKLMGDVKNYLLRVAHNALCDYARTTMPEDEGYSILLKDEIGDDVSSGFRTLVPPPPKKKNKQKPEDDLARLHKKVPSLFQTFYDLCNMDNGGKVPHEALQEIGKTAFLLVTTMPDSLSVGKKVMALHLWGHKQVDIAQKLDMNKQNVYRVLNTWFGRWHWTEDDIEKAQQCLMFHNLVDIASEVKMSFRRSKVPRGTKRVIEREPAFTWLKIEHNDNYGLLTPTFGFRETPSALYRYQPARARSEPCQNEMQRTIEAIGVYQSLLYKAVLNDERTKAWHRLLPEDKDVLDNFIYFLAGFGWGLDEGTKKPQYARYVHDKYLDDYDFDEDGDDGESSYDNDEPPFHSIHELC
jgi:hypothetical protein